MHFLFHLGALVAASSLALAGNRGNSRGGNGNAYGGNSGGGGKADDPVAMLCAVNKERQRAGRKPLGLDPKLVAAAVAHSKDQARTRKMSHTGSDGSKPSARVKKAGYNYKSTGENVAYGQKNVAEVMKDWMGSPGHKKNILDAKFTHFGSSVQYAGSTPYWTQEFGSGGASGPGTVPKCDGSDAYTPVGGDAGGDAGGDYGSGGDDMGGAGYGGDEPSGGGSGGSGGGKRRGGSRGGSKGDQGGDYGSDEESSGGRGGRSRGGDEMSSGGRRGGSRGGDYGGEEQSGRRGQQGGRRGQQGGRRGGQQDGAYGGGQQHGRQQGGRRGQQDSRRGGSRRGGEQQQGRRQGGDRRGGRSGGGSDY